MFASLALPVAPEFAPQIGDVVANFGQVARVVGTKEDGSLVLREVGGRMKWIADPAKCQPAG